MCVHIRSTKVSNTDGERIFSSCHSSSTPPILLIREKSTQELKNCGVSQQKKKTVLNTRGTGRAEWTQRQLYVFTALLRAVKLGVVPWIRKVVSVFKRKSSDCLQQCKTIVFYLCFLYSCNGHCIDECKLSTIAGKSQPQIRTQTWCMSRTTTILIMKTKTRRAWDGAKQNGKQMPKKPGIQKLAIKRNKSKETRKTGNETGEWLKESVCTNGAETGTRRSKVHKWKEKVHTHFSIKTHNTMGIEAQSWHCQSDGIITKRKRQPASLALCNMSANKRTCWWWWKDTKFSSFPEVDIWPRFVFNLSGPEDVYSVTKPSIRACNWWLLGIWGVRPKRAEINRGLKYWIFTAISVFPLLTPRGVIFWHHLLRRSYNYSRGGVIQEGVLFLSMSSFHFWQSKIEFKPSEN